VPANYGAWGICASDPTIFGALTNKMTSTAYSIRLTPPSSELSVSYGSTLSGNQAATLTSLAFISALLNPTTNSVVGNSQCGGSGYICLAANSRNTLTSGAKLCVAIANPTTRDVVLNVIAVSVLIDSSLMVLMGIQKKPLI
ncbi:12480_t:CDS:2, partial [Entrophospora sp. SA101]